MFKERKSWTANKLKWSLLLALAVVTTSANAFNVSIKAGSINIAQNPWYDPETSPTPAPTADYMQAHMINVDGVEEFVYLANGDVKVRALKSNGDVGYDLVIDRDALFKANFVATVPGMAISRLKAWVTIYNNVNASTGQSFQLTGPSGASPIEEFPTTYDHATAPHTYEDSHTVVIPGNLVQPGLRWTLNWYVFDSEPDPTGKSPILSAHHIDSEEISVSKFDAYTPGPADWLAHSEKPFEGTQHTSHAPDDLHGIDWSAETWDGAIYNPSIMGREDFYAAMCPNGRVRGLRELFYQHNPFSDVKNPTKGEVDEWHRLLINHIRTLVGLPMPQYEMKKSYCTFAQSQWFDERKHTTGWNTKYPDGICGPGSGSHCGFTFIPNPEDQGPYLPKGHPSCGPGFSGSEGMLGASVSAPWSIKFSGTFCGVLNHEGYWGGHVGPFWGRTKFGLSFWPTGGVRANWTGTRLPQLYCNPNDPENFPGCDPNNTGP